MKKAAPIFTKNGYVATSLSDITKATGLTKGAIYGNFKNKEELAIACFNLNVKSLLRRITDHQMLSDSPLEKLFLVTDFYRKYYDYSQELGGCPVLNVGVDAVNQNEVLLQHVQFTIERIENNVIKLVDAGKACGEIKASVDAAAFAKKLYAVIQGAIFMTYTMDNNSYLLETMDLVDQTIITELKK
ncbi:TetR/AcrR family transcriptional regulator [Aquimarina brevivitae]|uniref:TetR/AcrR family transcriptional regulator n=1 Tax=Aquimarina brevivitae TaxID=323412 RepID=UPI001F5F491C|nr:TetR/AcrR family transcriptional regulator [Aquimarina brevivitae]